MTHAESREPPFVPPAVPARVALTQSSHTYLLRKMADAGEDPAVDGRDDSEGSIDMHSSAGSDGDAEKEGALHLNFPGVPQKMNKVLLMGGSRFEEFFEPLRLQVTTPKELYTVLRLLNEGAQLSSLICRATGITRLPKSWSPGASSHR